MDDVYIVVWHMRARESNPGEHETSDNHYPAFLQWRAWLQKGHHWALQISAACHSTGVYCGGEAWQEVPQLVESCLFRSVECHRHELAIGHTKEP